MTNLVNFQLTQLQLRSQANPDLSYSFSVCSGLVHSSKRSRASSNQKQPRFSRKKSKQSVERFRNKVKSIDKVNSSMCSTNKQQSKCPKIPKKPSPTSHHHKQKSPIKKNFNNLYNIQHRNKETTLKHLFKQNKQDNPSPQKPSQYYKNTSKQNRPHSKSQDRKLCHNRISSQQQHRQSSGWNIKYLPMSDVLNYNEEPVTNKRLIERRLLNKIQINMSYF